jgi:metal-responsive CopG/Arc/MetJ family transcriptional regulator
MYIGCRRTSIMRTTIELKDEYRAKLLQIAARRGEKGFSKLIDEAVDLYLKTVAADEEQRQQALLLQGCLGKKDADQLRAATTALRESWR